MTARVSIDYLLDVKSKFTGSNVAHKIRNHFRSYIAYFLFNFYTILVVVNSCFKIGFCDNQFKNKIVGSNY